MHAQEVLIICPSCTNRLCKTFPANYYASICFRMESTANDQN